MFHYTLLTLLLINIYSIKCFEEKSFSVFGKLQSGFQIASKLLGLDQASGVANLVSETFGKTHKKGDAGEPGNNIFSGFIRVLGFNAKKIGAVAVNAIIFIAQLISSTLSRPQPSQLIEARDLKPGSPIDWIMNNTKMSDLIQHASDTQLPKDIITFIKEHSLDEETDCVQLLICKATPFIWGMQKALDKNNTKRPQGSEALFAYLPSLEEVEEYGDSCEKRHPYCFVHL